MFFEKFKIKYLKHNFFKFQDMGHRDTYWLIRKNLSITPTVKCNMYYNKSFDINDKMYLNLIF